MKTSGTKWPSKTRRKIAAWREWLRDKLTPTIEVADKGKPFRFRCRSPLEELRAETLFIKEEGTIRWIRSAVRKGEVFYDIGANIGLYSLVAARRVGPQGRVVAFEPHPSNVVSLLQNISLNRIADRTDVFTCPLTDVSGFIEFNMKAMTPGSSMSQLGTTQDAEGRSFRPQATEMKYACSVDSLIDSGAVRAPDHIKIDVDGNEPQILKGMCGLLSSAKPPATIQVEINHGCNQLVEEFLNSYGYAMDERHFTHAGKRKLERGIAVEDIAHNAVFQSRKAA